MRLIFNNFRASGHFRKEKDSGYSIGLSSQFIIFIIVALGSLQSCSGNKKKDIVVNQNSVICNKLTHYCCKANPGNCYEAFVPVGTKDGEQLPMIIFFDPAGKGEIPVGRYSALATKYKYIVVGSKSTKNGMPWSELTKITSELIADATARFNTAPRRLYLSGFSGGGRIASGYAVDKGGVTGVATCSAGLPLTEGTIRNSFNMIGFSGDEDMNFLELKQHESSLKGTNIPFHLVTFQGEHAWPEAEVFEKAFLWFEFQAMRSKIILKNDSLIAAYMKAAENQTNTFLLGGNTKGTYELSTEVIHFVKDLTDVSEYESMKKKALDDKKFVSEAVKIDQLYLMETQKQQEYVTALNEKDISWWKAETERVFSDIKASSWREESAMLKRTLNYASLAVYMMTTRARSSNDSVAFFRDVAIYSLVDPENPETKFLQAVIAAQHGDAAAVVFNLKESLELGLEDKSRLTHDPAFAAFQNEPEFLDLLK
ncbi:MAG: hypothetical protein KKA07_09005 [Bacteroidetes bacterium]|nr:hypothetical protein [Bacteroidota bacterium]